MLKIKKCRSKREEYIVYDPNNFERHTHCYSKRIALKLKYLVSNKIVPTSTNKQLVISCIRLTRDRRYKEQLQAYLKHYRPKSRKTIHKYIRCPITA